MAETILNLPAQFAKMVPGIPLGTSCQDIRDAIATVNLRAGGVESIYEDTTIAGTGIANDYTKITTLLNTPGGVKRVTGAGTFLCSSSGTVITEPISLIGNYADTSIFTRGDVASGASMFSFRNSVDVRGILFRDGGVWFQGDGITSAVSFVGIRGCKFIDVRSPIQHATTSPNAGDQIDRFVFDDNYVNADNVSLLLPRGINIDAHGASNVRISNNYIYNVATVAIRCFGRAGSQTGNKNNRLLVYGNFVLNLYPDDTPSAENMVHLSGKFGITALNHFHDFIFNATAGVNAANVEGYYDKLIYAIVALNTFKNAGGGGQAAVASKGGKRDGTTPASGATGYVGIILGNIVVYDLTGAHGGTAHQYLNSDGFWIQKEDAQIIANCGDNIPGFQVYFQEDFDFRGAGIIASCFTEANGSIQVRGPQTMVRIIGNRLEKKQDGGFIILRADNGDDQKDVICLGNQLSFSSFTTPIANTIGSTAFYQLDTQTSGDLIGIIISGGICDGEFYPNAANTMRGVQVIGNGTITDVLVHGMVFRNFGDATTILAQTSGTATGTLIVGDTVIGSGFLNRNEGTATITSGNTSVTFNPSLTQCVGFNMTLHHSDIDIGPMEDPQQRFWWTIDSPTAVTIHIASAAASDIDFSWKAYKRKFSLA